MIKKQKHKIVQACKKNKMYIVANNKSTTSRYPEKSYKI